MIRLSTRKGLFFLSTVLFSAASIAQTQSPPPSSGDWKAANEAVGTLKRGHADVLDWEQNNAPDTAEPSSVPPDLILMTEEETIRLAWRAHRDLAPQLAALGSDTVGRLAAGAWAALDPLELRRQPDSKEILDIAARTRKAWFYAIAARQIVKHRREALAAAEAADELGRRMADIGNWSKLQQAQQQVAVETARIDLSRAQYSAIKAQSDLLKSLQMDALHTSVALPDALPAIPPAFISDLEAQRRLTATIDPLPRAEAFRTKANAVPALSAYRAAYALAVSQTSTLKLREFIAEETLLRYNGMLKSVWDLLGEARKRSQARVDAITAQRDFWIAQTDLQLVFQGSAPAAFISLAADGGGDENGSAAGH